MCYSSSWNLYIYYFFVWNYALSQLTLSWRPGHFFSNVCPTGSVPHVFTAVQLDRTCNSIPKHGHIMLNLLVIMRSHLFLWVWTDLFECCIHIKRKHVCFRSRNLHGTYSAYVRKEQTLPIYLCVSKALFISDLVRVAKAAVRGFENVEHGGWGTYLPSLFSA